jgi:hypothetical protein
MTHARRATLMQRESRLTRVRIRFSAHIEDDVRTMRTRSKRTSARRREQAPSAVDQPSDPSRRSEILPLRWSSACVAIHKKYVKIWGILQILNSIVRMAGGGERVPTRRDARPRTASVRSGRWPISCAGQTTAPRCAGVARALKKKLRATEKFRRGDEKQDA